jgi:hypothetical protein
MSQKNNALVGRERPPTHQLEKDRSSANAFLGSLVAPAIRDLVVLCGRADWAGKRVFIMAPDVETLRLAGGGGFRFFGGAIRESHTCSKGPCSRHRRHKAPNRGDGKERLPGVRDAQRPSALGAAGRPGHANRGRVAPPATCGKPQCFRRAALARFRQA